MALSPEIEIDDSFDELDQEDEQIVIKTFKIDLETMKVTTEIIEGIEAMKQIIYLAFRIPRFAHPIFSDHVGNEIDDLLSDNETTIDFKIMELERLIRETLIYLDFIEDVIDIEIEHTDDKFNSTFTVVTTEGTIEFKEVFG